MDKGGDSCNNAYVWIDIIDYLFLLSAGYVNPHSPLYSTLVKYSTCLLPCLSCVPHKIPLRLYILGKTAEHVAEKRERVKVNNLIIKSIYLAGLLPEVIYMYMVLSVHICTDISVDAELARGGGWIYPEGVGTGEQIITNMTSYQVTSRR